MTTKDEKLAAIAREVGIGVPNLIKFLNGDMSPMQVQTLVPGNMGDRISLALSANGEGVFYTIVSPRELPMTMGQGSSDYVSVVRSGIQQQTRQKNYHTLYGVSNKYIADEDFFRHVFAKYDGAGVICIIPQNVEAITAACNALNMPCLLMDYETDALFDQMHILNTDNAQGSFDAVKYLIDLGHTRIAYIAGFLSFTSAQARLRGYREALASAGIAYDEMLVEEGDWTNESGEKFMLKMLQLDAPPTALVAANDMMAVGAIIEAKKQGVKVPDEISIIGCDDIPMASTMSPSLTTLRQPMQEMGMTAADIIIRALEGQPLETQKHTMPLELVVRDSTASVPTRK